MRASIKNLSRPGCRSCTSEDLWVVVAEGQCANRHDLRDSAEPEVLGVPELLHVLEALWRMPVGNITVSFCTSSYGLNKDWTRRKTVLQFLHQHHLFEDLAGIKLRCFFEVDNGCCQCECSRSERGSRLNAHLLEFKTRFSNLYCVAAAKGLKRLETQLPSPLVPAWHAFDAMCTL